MNTQRRRHTHKNSTGMKFTCLLLAIAPTRTTTLITNTIGLRVGLLRRSTWQYHFSGKRLTRTSLTSSADNLFFKTITMAKTRSSSNGGSKERSSSTTNLESSPSSSSSSSPAKRKSSRHGEITSNKKKLAKKVKPIKEEKSDTSKVATTPHEDGPWYRALFTKGDEEYDRYMSTEWGFEKRGDVGLFEKLSLEGAQSGLSWLTILRKREAYRSTFHGFDIDRVAEMTEEDVERIINSENADNPRQLVVRHRGKIQAVIHNAQCIQEMIQKDGCGEEEKEEDCKSESTTKKNTTTTKKDTNVLDDFLWSFVNDQPILNRWNGNLHDAPTKTPESEAMSKALKKRGFKFVGPTTCYAMMQSVGMVIDHPENSPEWKAALERLQKRPGGYQDPKK